ncbi:hypothetical protein OIDMADRAFT_61199 [Oidiodendron maius Zn]|uniref:Uncharacterized protein n=1 Tax=Oidiodendron maius (strain Zn) TaxID=913774 RepID=A0A0C3GU65_OIDMZ|nr:hypothetical protein OIDMADRAFT_61199 [Oidiodendron maius Zn]
MAPRKRARRDPNTATKVLLLIERNSDPISPLPDSCNSAETGIYEDTSQGRQDLQQCETRETKRKLRPGKRDLKLGVGSILGSADPLKFYNMFEEMNHIVYKKELEHEREKKAALGCAYILNIFFLLSDTDSDSVSPLHNNSVASNDTYCIPFSDTDSSKSEPMLEDPRERLEYA